MEQARSGEEGFHQNSGHEPAQFTGGNNKRRVFHGGRQPLSEPENFEEAVALYNSGELTGVGAAKQYGMNVNTFYKKARKRK